MLSKLEFKDVSIIKGAEVDGVSVKSLFCNNWLAAKLCLAAMMAAIKNPVVKLVVSLVINVGNRLEEEFCA